VPLGTQSYNFQSPPLTLSCKILCHLMIVQKSCIKTNGIKKRLPFETVNKYRKYDWLFLSSSWVPSFIYSTCWCEILFVICAVAEVAAATFPGNGSPGAALQHTDILSYSCLYAVCRLPIHAARVHSMY